MAWLLTRLHRSAYGVRVQKFNTGHRQYQIIGWGYPTDLAHPHNPETMDFHKVCLTSVIALTWYIAEI